MFRSPRSPIAAAVVAMVAGCGGGGSDSMPGGASGADVDAPIIALTSPAALASGRLDLANGNAYTFAKLSGAPVDMLVGNDGALYVLSRSGVTRISSP